MPGYARLPAKFRLALAWVVLGTWATSFLAAIIVHNYEPPAELNALMLLIVSMAFGLRDGGGGTSA